MKLKLNKTAAIILVILGLIMASVASSSILLTGKHSTSIKLGGQG